MMNPMCYVYVIICALLSIISLHVTHVRGARWVCCVLELIRSETQNPEHQSLLSSDF
jgi:hypothetical protein